MEKQRNPYRWTKWNTIVVVIAVIVLLLCLNLPPFCMHFSVDRTLSGELQTLEGETVAPASVKMQGEMTYRMFADAEYEGAFTLKGGGFDTNKTVWMKGSHISLFRFHSGIHYVAGILSIDQDWGGYNILWVEHDWNMKHMTLYLWDKKAECGYQLVAAA